MIILDDSHYLGKGGTKTVYRHPKDPNICIKFPKSGKKHALRTIIHEVRYLKKHQSNLSWIAPYLGTTDCNLGTGYMFEMVRNEDGSPSECIKVSDCEKNASAVRNKIADMYFDLIQLHAVVNDLKLANIFFRKKVPEGFDLVLVDGFGNNNLIKIADFSKFFLIKKLNRKFDRLCTKLKIPTDFLV
jgi:hypothetical protein